MSPVALGCVALVCALLVMPFEPRGAVMYAPSVVALAAGIWASRRCTYVDLLESPGFCLIPALTFVPACLQLVTGRTISVSATVSCAVQSAATLALVVAFEKPARANVRCFRVTLLSLIALGVASFVLHQLAPTAIYGAAASGHVEYWGPFANRNMLALFVGLVTAGAAAVSWSSRNAWWLALPVLLAAGVASSGSRSGVLLLTAEWAVITVVSRRIWNLSIGRAIGAASVLLAALCLVVDPTAIAARIAAGDLFSARWMIYTASAKLVAAHPWAGVGMGAYVLAYPKFAVSDLGAVVDHAHNDWLEWASEGGLMLPLLMLVAVALCARSRVRHPMMLGLGALLLSSTVDYPLHRPNFSMFAIGFLALGFGAFPSRREFPYPSPAVRADESQKTTLHATWRQNETHVF